MNPHATIPLDYGCRAAVFPADSLDGGGLVYHIGHTYIGFYPDEHAIQIYERIAALRHEVSTRVFACAYPPYRFASIPIPNAELLEGEKDMDLIDIKNKNEAVAFICAVLKSAPSLASLNFNTAMDVSRAFDVSVQDVLEFRKVQAKVA